MNPEHWLRHFERNGRNRREPDWEAPVVWPERGLAGLRRSLAQFHLGDGGGPAYLIARDRERFLAAGEATRRLVDLWFAEEREHSRLLGRLVERFGATPITGHWSFSAFCLARRILGVRFELTVLLLTEISSTAYYRLLRRHGQDPCLREVCRQILRDEAGHIAFHRARLAGEGRPRGGWLLHVLGYAAATMLWVNHAPALWALGASTREFYREVRRELHRFTRPGRVGARRSVSAPDAAWRRSS